MGKLPPDSDLLSDISKRLVWEVLAELGYRASIGRSLERTGVAVLGIDPAPVEDAVQRLLSPLREHEGLSDISEAGLRRFMLGLLLYLKQRGAIHHRFLDAYIGTGGRNYQLKLQSYDLCGGNRISAKMRQDVRRTRPTELRNGYAARHPGKHSPRSALSFS